jgi:histidine triad (HIT) family protein
MSCIFCRIALEEIPADVVYQDDQVLAFRDLSPQAPTHILIIPRRHVEHLLDVSAEDAALLGHLMTRVPHIARAAGLEAEGFRLVSNCKEKAGQSVWHLHFHLLGGRSFAWPPG